MIEGVDAGAEYRVFSFLGEPEVEPSGEGRGVLVDEARDIDRSKPIAADAECCEFDPMGVGPWESWAPRVCRRSSQSSGLRRNLAVNPSRPFNR